MRRLLPLLALVSWAGSACAAALGPGVNEDVSLAVLPAVAQPAEIDRRLLSPLTALAAGRQPAHALDLEKQRFLVYLPARRPDAGYGMLVFISPGDQARLPHGWSGVLDRRGMVFATMANAGNDADALGRRVPLALSAAADLGGRLPIDRARVYVGGFSGGARVALRLALGYPDLFAGALLDAGSDAIGEALWAPPRALLERFQENSRVVYLTGARDDLHLSMDGHSQSSMRNWCVFGIDSISMPWSGHIEADPGSLGEALQALERPPPGHSAALDTCRAVLNAKAVEAFVILDAVIDAGDTAGAWTSLRALDLKFGGLVADRIMSAVRRLAERP